MRYLIDIVTIVPSWTQASIQENLNTYIESSKQRYYSRIANKLKIVQKNTRNYCSLQKTFLNTKKYHLYLFYTMKIVS